MTINKYLNLHAVERIDGYKKDPKHRDKCLLTSNNS